MSIDRAAVAKIASLARIKMSDEELDRIAPELNNILKFVDQLSEVDTSNVEPMTAVIPNTLRLREDEVNADPKTGGDRRDDVLANAPAAEHGFYGVPKVIE
ncbi:MAG: Asp-tRNA(Asn)/Glu-tRNA(Gln) amidotransferase subunit GatC [Marinomonas sp.]